MKTDVIGEQDQLERLLGTIEDAMTRQVVYVSSDMELGTAARLMESAGVSGAPVLDDDRLVGMVTLSDMFSRLPVRPQQVETSGPFHRWERALAQLSIRGSATVRDVLTPQVTTVRPDDPLALAALLMVRSRVNRLAVADAPGHVCGILTRDDVLRVVARVMNRL
jgi:CBS domain-containing protein